MAKIAAKAIKYSMGKYLILLLLIAACLYSAGISSAEDYVVREGDLLKITVYDHPDLTTTARVSGNGMISFPLIGEMHASGLTVSQVSQKLAELLADGFIVNPQVSVFLEEYKGRKIYVTGEVKRPDAYRFEEGATVIKVITVAGGFTEKAAPGRVKIMRKIDGKVEVLEKVMMDQLVQPDDVVVVPESFF